ncbi:ABC transporter ATP-binding protein, partial [Streptomyces sp. 2MCAF27]
RALRDGDSLLSALDESIASPAGLVARVDADGVLTGVTDRELIHEHAGRRHAAAARAATTQDSGSQDSGSQDSEDPQDPDAQDAAASVTA